MEQLSKIADESLRKDIEAAIEQALADAKKQAHMSARAQLWDELKKKISEKAGGAVQGERAEDMIDKLIAASKKPGEADSAKVDAAIAAARAEAQAAIEQEKRALKAQSLKDKIKSFAIQSGLDESYEALFDGALAQLEIVEDGDTIAFKRSGQFVLENGKPAGPKAVAAEILKAYPRLTKPVENTPRPAPRGADKNVADRLSAGLAELRLLQ